MKTHNKLKISGKQKDGLTKREWFELVMLVVFCLFAAAAVIAFIVACLRWGLSNI